MRLCLSVISWYLLLSSKLFLNIPMKNTLNNFLIFCITKYFFRSNGRVNTPFSGQTSTFLTACGNIVRTAVDNCEMSRYISTDLLLIQWIYKTGIILYHIFSQMKIELSVCR